MRAVLLAGALGLAITLLGTRAAILWLRRHGFGQPVRVDGPTTHLVKRGTPTMGGLVILGGSTLSYLVSRLTLHGLPSASAVLLMLAFWGCAAIGFLDDYIKVYQQDNRGLPGRWKMVGQALVALTFGIAGTTSFADHRGLHPASRSLSITEDWGPRLPLVLVLLVIWFVMTGTSNATNLTDGMDGLLTGISAMVFGAYALITLWQNNQQCGSNRPTVIESRCYEVRDPLDLAIYCAGIAGACAGFLWWNAKPAKIFMGDVGSLALGGALAAVAIMSRTEVLMALVGGVFVVETLSVMLQVSYFKLTRKLTGTGRRIFRITPIHHHFEHAGWDEVNVVIRFWLIAGVFIVLAVCLFYAAWLV